MKSFVIKFLIFLLPILILLFPLDLYISKNLKKSGTFVTGEYQIWNDIYNEKINQDILLYGASRAIYLNPSTFEDSLKTTCYNLGINGLGFSHIYLRHRELIKHNKWPKYIILSLDSFSLMKGVNLFNSDQFLPYMLGNENFRQYLKKVNKFTIFDYYVPLIRYYGRRKAIQEAVKCSQPYYVNIPLRHKGYMVLEMDWTDDLSIAQDSLGQMQVVNDHSSLALFDKFLKECKNHNTQVVFVNTPEYIEGQLFIKNRKEIISTYAMFSEKYDILFLDYSNDKMCYNRDYFYNSQHLNKIGAELFNIKLVSDLKNMNKQQKILTDF